MLVSPFSISHRLSVPQAVYLMSNEDTELTSAFLESLLYSAAFTNELDDNADQDSEVLLTFDYDCDVSADLFATLNDTHQTIACYIDDSADLNLTPDADEPFVECSEMRKPVDPTEFSVGG
jgi:hypothetical protein